MAASLLPSFDLEKELISQGFSLIAGVDEAGRGALAGPLSLGLVLYDPSFILTAATSELNSINDSKKLTHRQREKAYTIINKLSIVSHYTMVSHQCIDRLNVNGATEYALQKILKLIPIKPDIILLDGNFSFSCTIPILPVRGGDARSITIASASIIAKVQRDSILYKFDSLFPGYDFKKNKGYGTKGHFRALESNGFSPIHRKSYYPIKEMIHKATNEN